MSWKERTIFFFFPPGSCSLFFKRNSLLDALRDSSWILVSLCSAHSAVRVRPVFVTGWYRTEVGILPRCRKNWDLFLAKEEEAHSGAECPGWGWGEKWEA